LKTIYNPEATMSKKYTIPETESQMVAEPAATYASQPTTLHLDINLEDNAIISDIKKAIKMIKGIAAVRISPSSEDNVITSALAKKIAKARHDYAEGRYTECRTKEELDSFLNAL